MLFYPSQGNLNATRPSLLGNPMIAQANSMLQNLVTQQGSLATLLQLKPPGGSSGQGLTDNTGGINLNQLNNWNQLIGFLQATMVDSSKQPKEDSDPSIGRRTKTGLLGDAPGQSGSLGTLGSRDSETGPKPSLLGLGPTPETNGKRGLLGDSPTSGLIGGEPPGRPILGAGTIAPLLPSAPPLFAEMGNDNGGGPNVGPANTLLALFLENQIRAQLQSLQGRGHAGGVALLNRSLRQPGVQNGSGSLLGAPPQSAGSQGATMNLNSANNNSLSQRPLSRTLLPNPSSAPLGMEEGKKPGLLGEHPGCQPTWPWRQQGNGGDKQTSSTSGEGGGGRSNLPSTTTGNKERRGLLGDAPQEVRIGFIFFTFYKCWVLFHKIYLLLREVVVKSHINKF